MIDCRTNDEPAAFKGSGYEKEECWILIRWPILLYESLGCAAPLVLWFRGQQVNWVQPTRRPLVNLCRYGNRYGSGRADAWLSANRFSLLSFWHDMEEKIVLRWAWSSDSLAAGESSPVVLLFVSVQSSWQWAVFMSPQFTAQDAHLGTQNLV